LSNELSRPDEGLIFHFAFEAFKSLRALLEITCAGTEVGSLVDMDWATLEFKVSGAVITLDRDSYDGFTSVSAGPRGRAVLESLRPLLDTPDHPILKQIG
jgi:hypothetical protein